MGGHFKTNILFFQSSLRKTCPHCTYTTMDQEDLEAHKSALHPDLAKDSETKASLTCPQCSKSFGTPAARTRHIQIIHEKVTRFKCPFQNCSYKAYYLVDVKEHHKKDHSFTAPDDSNFAIKQLNLVDLICIHCHKNFRSDFLLQKHTEMFH